MLILWSGGLDSTLVLYYALKWWHGHKNVEWSTQLNIGKYKFTKNDLEPRAVSIECSQFASGQSEKQKEARKRLTGIFENWGYTFIQDTIKIDTGGQYGGMFPQPIIWTLHSTLLVRQNEPLLTGFIRGDDAMAKMDKIESAWSLLTEINGIESKMLSPLRYNSKHEVLAEMDKLKLTKECWYCDSHADVDEPCGECGSCLNVIGARSIMRRIKKQKRILTL